MTIKLNTLNKHVEYLNGINALAMADRIYSADIIKARSTYAVAGSLFTTATKLNYFTKIDRGVYKSNVIRFEPKHARTLIEADGEYKKLSKASSKRKKKSPSKKKYTGEVLNPGDTNVTLEYVWKNHPEAERKQQEVFIGDVISPSAKVKQTRKRRKVFSLFWGLIKFNY
jgi:hypothetical protein